MNAVKQAVWLLIALLALAGSGWYFASSKLVIKLDDQTLSTTPDTIISELTVQQFDAKGQLSQYLQTPLMRHIPLDNTHQLETPHIIITQLNQPSWEIHAKNATALHGGQQITFNHHVIIHQNKDANREETTLATEELTYFPKDQLATTPKAISIVQAKNTVRSVGMKAYLAENRVQLLSEARGTYVPNHG